MSSHRHHLHASQDPTKTKTVRRQYAQRLRGAYDRINAAIREGVIRDDIFGLQNNNSLFGSDANLDEKTEQLRRGLVASMGEASTHELTAVDKPPNFSFRTDDKKIEAFQSWLQSAQEDEVLEVIGRDENRFIRQAYHRGLENGKRDLEAAGFQGNIESAEQAFNLPIHGERVQQLYTRNFTELQGITREVDRQVSRELADGFSQGKNPNDIARDITNRVDKIGKTRATTLARTEVIRSHAEGQLNRFERMGVGEVSVKAELLTAGDSRVCDQCASLEGNVYSLEEARGLIPVHPGCRCRHIPLVNN